MKTTSAERAKRRRTKLDKFAQENGYTSWVKLSTAALSGDIMIINIRPPVDETKEFRE